jgi:DNA-binding CsgD family transcriptional regulator/PAS domain-containing protein
MDDSAERLSTLVGNIYDASLDTALWPAALGQAAAFVGGLGGGLLAKDVVDQTANIFYYDGSIAPHFIQLYFEKYVKLDPGTTRHFFAEVGELVSTTDILEYDEFCRTRFYREWARPQQLVDYLSVTLEKTETSVAMFGVFRHERDGLVDEATRRRMHLLVPHVRRAVLIGRAIELKTLEANTFAHTLDGLAAGVFLVDASGRIVHVNAAGVIMLNAGDVLHGRAGRLSAVDPRANQALRDAFAAASLGDMALGAQGIAHALSSSNDEHYVAHVLPLVSNARRKAAAASAVAALFVRKAALHGIAAPEAIAKAYRLTPTELRVLLAIAESGGGTRDIARALGIAETTTKFHLRQLFEKTGVKRQAELVKLVAGFASPLAH